VVLRRERAEVQAVLVERVLDRQPSVLGSTSGQGPTGERATVAIALSHELRTRDPAQVGCAPDERTAVLDGLGRVLERSDWVVAAAEEIDWSTERTRWMIDNYHLPIALRERVEGAH
jgi:hypothetical protein